MPPWVCRGNNDLGKSMVLGTQGDGAGLPELHLVSLSDFGFG